VGFQALSPAKPSQAKPNQTTHWSGSSTGVGPRGRILGSLVLSWLRSNWSRAASRSREVRRVTCAAGTLLTQSSFFLTGDGTVALSTTIWTGWLARLAASQPVSAPRCLLTYSRFFPPPPFHAGPFAEVSVRRQAGTRPT
jgi:hypothetical protein